MINLWKTQVTLGAEGEARTAQGKGFNSDPTAPCSSVCLPSHSHSFMENNVEPSWLMRHRQSVGWHGQMSRALSRDAIGWQRENLGLRSHKVCTKACAAPQRTMWRVLGPAHMPWALSLWWDWLQVLRLGVLGRCSVEHKMNSYAHEHAQRPRTRDRREGTAAQVYLKVLDFLQLKKISLDLKSLFLSSNIAYWKTETLLISIRSYILLHNNNYWLFYKCVFGSLFECM